MTHKLLEAWFRRILESPNTDRLIESATERLAQLGVTMRPVYPEPWPDADFSADDPNIEDACDQAWHVAELQTMRDMARSGLEFIEEEKERLRPVTKRRTDKSGAAMTEQANSRRREILNAYAKWAAKPKNSKSTQTDFANQFAATKRKNKKSRGYGKSTISNAVSEFEEFVVAKWAKLGLPAKSRSTVEVVTQVSGTMKGQPGVTFETVRRALQ